MAASPTPSPAFLSSLRRLLFRCFIPFPLSTDFTLHEGINSLRADIELKHIAHKSCFLDMLYDHFPYNDGKTTIATCGLI